MIKISILKHERPWAKRDYFIGTLLGIASIGLIFHYYLHYYEGLNPSTEDCLQNPDQVYKFSDDYTGTCELYIKTFNRHWLFEGSTWTNEFKIRYDNLAEENYQLKYCITHPTDDLPGRNEYSTVLYMPFDDVTGLGEGAGNFTRDISMYNHNSTCSNIVVCNWTSGKFGKGIDFNATNISVRTPCILLFQSVINSWNNSA